MALSNGQYDVIMREYDEKRSFHRGEQMRRTETVYEELPKLAQLETSLSSLASRQARRLLEGDTNAVEDLKSEYEQIRREKEELLTGAGYPADYLEMQYDCPLCKDTGFVDGQKCRCFRRRELEILYHQSRIRGRLEKENFSTCTDQCYSDTRLVEGTNQTVRSYMQGVIAQCRRYAADFDSLGGNLLFYGSTGVGKTFLAGCIARELIESYHSVIYLSAMELFDRLARERFDRAEESDGSETQMILDCELLIIDDLGTELSNSFTNSQLFYCLNERLLRKKATIITTNLTPGQLGREYSERIASRLIENYKFISIPPGDIRIWKQREQRKRQGGE